MLHRNPFLVQTRGVLLLLEIEMPVKIEVLYFFLHRTPEQSLQPSTTPPGP